MFGIFTPAQALQYFSADFLDQAKCEAWILEKIYPHGFRCPRCKILLRAAHQVKAIQEFRRTKCLECGKFFSTGAGTFLAGTHFDFQQIYMIALFLAIGMDNVMIADRMECTPETIRLWRLKFSKLA